MVIKSKHVHDHPWENIKIMFCEKHLSQIDFCKYLGVYIDNQLLWRHHISAICKKIAPVIGI